MYAVGVRRGAAVVTSMSSWRDGSCSTPLTWPGRVSVRMASGRKPAAEGPLMSSRADAGSPAMTRLADTLVVIRLPGVTATNLPGALAFATI
jgi:hypothetical protein